MSWVNGLTARVRAIFRRERVLEDMDEEFRAHIELLVDENVASGMDPAEARRAALAHFGNVGGARDVAFDVRGGALDVLRQDVRHGARGMLRNRGFSTVVVLTLALGIGANTAVFSVVNAVFLRPLPYRDSDRLVALGGEVHTPGTFTDLRTETKTLEDVAAVRPVDLSLTGSGTPERLTAQAVTGNLLGMLGVAPAIGRDFDADEARYGGPLAVILSDGLWRRRFGAAPEVVGSELTLDGRKCTVVGVMPPGFQLFERRAEIWFPLRFGPKELTNRLSHNLEVIGRLAPGSAPGQVRDEAQALTDRVFRENPDSAGQAPATAVPLRERVAGDARTSLFVLLGSVALVLLIACINVGNLLLSRAVVRRREITVRAALGASRGRVLRQLLAENVPLVAAGTALGVALAWWSLGFLRQLVPPAMGSSADLVLDARVLVFTLGVTAGATLLFGMIPAIQVLRLDLNEALRSGSARTGVSSGGRLQSLLVVGEVGLAIALLVGASLLVRTFFSLRGQYAGLGGASVLTMKTVLSPTSYADHASREAFFSRVLERVQTLPGVVEAGYTNALPLDYKGDSTNVTADGHVPPPGVENDASTRLVTSGMLPALGVPLVEGRHLTDGDGPDAQRVAVINETMASKYWEGEPALGGRFHIGTGQEGEEDLPWVTVVGIVADVRQHDADEPARPEIYLPYRQTDYMEVFAPKTLVVRTAGNGRAIPAAIQTEVTAIDPNQPLSDVRSFDDIVGEELSGRRTGTLLLGAFATVALLLASIGLYGLLAHRVERMTPELGVRLALGARPRDIVALVVWRGMRLVLVGTVVGLALALAGSRLIESMLFGVSPADAVTLAGVPALLVVVALVACLAPARRAAGVDPNTALRAE